MTIALNIKNLTKTYNNGFKALKGINLSVEEGDFFALLGPNGAGKSTTIGIISGLINKSSGEVSVFDSSIDKNHNELKKYLGIVPQEFNFAIFESPFDILTTQAGYFGIPFHIAKLRAETLLKQLDIFDKKDTPSRNLSGGMKRRLMIARALMHEPKVLILDEPTAGVDIELRRSMWDFLIELNKNGTTIILTTHYLEEAEQLCKNIAIINKGEIAEHTSMKELLSRLENQTFVLDIKNKISQAPIIEGFKIDLIDDKTIEVQTNCNQNLNEVFTSLQQQDIEVVSLRNKTNRLEELFVSILDKKAEKEINKEG